MFLLLLYVAIFLKLISYSMVQYWCRNGYPTEEQNGIGNGLVTNYASADEGFVVKPAKRHRKLNVRKRTKMFAVLGKCDSFQNSSAIGISIIILVVNILLEKMNMTIIFCTDFVFFFQLYHICILLLCSFYILIVK